MINFKDLIAHKNDSVFSLIAISSEKKRLKKNLFAFNSLPDNKQKQFPFSL